MIATVEQLVQQATHLASSGRWQEAERVWLEVRRIDPGHPKALFSLGVHALDRGDLQVARELLVAARAVAPSDLVILLTLSNVCRQLNDAESEREAIEAALVVDPYSLPALLAKAGWLERFGTSATAAAMYGHALTVAPAESHWPPMFRTQLEHGRALVTRHRNALGTFLQGRLAAAGELSPELRSRWKEAVSIMAGLTKPQVSNSNQLHVPRLPAKPFFERSYFPWMNELEAQTTRIRGELEAVLKADAEKFTPYIGYNPGEPVGQWHELNHSTKWSALHLWRSGTPVRENLERCPATAAALSVLPMADMSGLCPNAMFSALAPHTHIPPHHGETNARLVAHLPLIVPEGCRFRVGFDECQWRVGEVLVFDDTIEHEAFNDSDELRVVLIFDVWNPLLAPEERRMASALAEAARQFGAANTAHAS